MVPTILNLSRHTGLHLYTRMSFTPLLVTRHELQRACVWHGILASYHVWFLLTLQELRLTEAPRTPSCYRGLLTFCRGQLLSPAIGLTIFSQLNRVICSLQGCSLSFTNTRAWLWFQAELSQAPVASPSTCNNAVNVIGCLFISSLSSEIVWLAVW